MKSFILSTAKGKIEKKSQTVSESDCTVVGRVEHVQFVFHKG